MKCILQFIVIAFAWTWCAPVSFAQQEPPLPVVKIGFIVPLVGGLAARGDDIAKLTTILKERFERAGLKHRYEFTVEDGGCGVSNAATRAAMKLIHVEKVKYLIAGCSGEILQVAPIAESNKVITIGVLSLHKDIRHAGDYIFRTFMDIEQSLHAMAEHMAAENEGKLAILTEENAFTADIRDQFVSYLGSKVVYTEEFAPDQLDFSSMLLKANARGAKGFYLNALSDRSLAALVNRIRQQRLTQKLYSFTMPEVPTFRAVTGANSNDLEFIGTPALTKNSEEFNSVLEEYHRRYPGGPSLEFLVGTTFDAIKAIIAGVEAVGDDTTRVKDFLYHYSAPGALGTVAFDANGDIRDLHYVLKRITADGRTEAVRPLVVKK